ncbi:hypothetical protein IW148_003639 [Coemansia sp. RSA 1199]|nr:hypothetical protein IW148_003639 [Coemansia sp. RSA 1199]
MRCLAVVGLFAASLEAAVPNGARARPIIVENQVSRVSGNSDLPELIDIGPLVSVAAKLASSSKPPINSAPVHTSASPHSATPVLKNVEPSVTPHAVSTTINHPRVSAAKIVEETAKPSPVSDKDVESEDHDTKEAPSQINAVDAPKYRPHVSAFKKVVVANKVKVTTIVDENSTDDRAQSDFDLLNQYARMDESSATLVSQGWALVAVVGYFCVTNYF